MLDGRLWVHADLNTFESRVTRYSWVSSSDRGSVIDSALLETVSSAAAGLVETRPHRDGLELCVVDADESFAEQVSQRAGGQIIAMETTLQDRVIAYLSQCRSGRLIDDSDASKSSPRSTA